MINNKITLSWFLIILFISIGVIATLGMSYGIKYTNTEKFCISCHEMQNNVYQEYLDSPHDVNPSGVRATCPDCHVPHEFVPLMTKKIIASKDVWHWVLGTIDTQEKFEARRLIMAKRVWQEMQENDSRECRHCHKTSAMDLDYQDNSAKKKHLKAQKQQMTCIDCHQGIAHELPETKD